MATELSIASTRFNTGITTSATFVVTATAVSSLTVALTIATSNLTNTANSITVTLQQQQGVSWVDVANLSWTGDPTAMNPSFTIPTDTSDGLGHLLTTLRGSTCRLQINANTRITSSITVTTA